MQNAGSQVQLPETTYEQRRQFYDDVEAMLCPGFLSCRVDVGGVVVNLRSPSPGDLFLIRERSGDEGSDRPWVLWSLATCTWMVDGYVVLGDVNSAANLFHLYKGLPKSVSNNMFSVLMMLFDRARRAIDGVMPYGYESVSRMRWLQMNQRMPNDERVTGVPGTHMLGLNAVQKVWLAFNQVEDRRQEEDSYWQHAKFVASAHAPKHVKQVDSREKTRTRHVEQQRQQDMDCYYYRCMGVIDGDNKLSDGRRLMKVAKTVEDLSDEYWRWVNNEDDEHDRVVEEYKLSIRLKYEEEKRRREEEWAKIREQFDRGSDESLPDTPDRLIGYDARDVQEALRGRGSGVKRVYDSREAAREHIYTQHILNRELPPPAGGFSVDGEGRLVSPESRTLDDKVGSRRPTLRTTDGDSR